MRIIKIPEEAVPAVLGLNGKKMSDTMARTGSRINIKRTADDILATVYIDQGDTSLAENLIVQAVRHYFSAVKPLPAKQGGRISKDEIVLMDLKCIMFHIQALKAT